MNNVLLNNVDHHDLRVITGYGAEFGDNLSQVQVFPTEFEDIQREYPIVFRNDIGGVPRPVALLGLGRSENLFLDEAGGWDACYVPALQQRGPFSISAPPSGDGEPMIKIDLDHPRISRSEGTPIFLSQGGNSPYLEKVTAVLRAIYIGHRLLDPMIEAFQSAGLLRPVNIEARVSETEVYAVSGAQAIDRERLAALDAEELHALHQAGFLHSAFMAAASLGNVQRLVERKNRLVAGSDSA